MAIEILGFPIKYGDVPQRCQFTRKKKKNAYQRVLYELIELEPLEYVHDNYDTACACYSRYHDYYNILTVQWPVSDIEEGDIELWKQLGLHISIQIYPALSKDPTDIMTLR